MKHKAKALEIKFSEPEAFTLVVEQATDGDRITQEKQQRETDRVEAEKQQLNLV